jgi:peptidyl-prolyl cis-trans isomerase SurA
MSALALTAFTNCNGGGGPKDPGNTEIAATVNGKEIKLAEVDSIISFQTQGRQGEMTPLQMAGARLQVISKLVEEEVLYQKAEKEKFQPSDDEINRAIDQGKQGQTQEAFDKNLKDQGLTPESFRDKIKRQLAVGKMQEKYTTGEGFNIKDKEVEDAYNSNKAAFVNKRGAELASIIVDAKDNGGQDDAKSAAEAQIKIKDIATQLQQGADFAEIARRRSEAPNAAQGGDMGFIEEEQMRQQYGDGFAAGVMGKRAGDIIGPFAAGEQIIILKVKRAQTQNENLTLESPGVREQVIEALRNQRKQLVWAAVTEMAINEAKVVNYVAEKITKSPANLGGSRFAGDASATPGASPSASPTANASPGAGDKDKPAANASPAASATPAANSSPAASPGK